MAVYSHEKIEQLLRGKILRARRARSYGSEKRPSRNVLRFIMDVVEAVRGSGKESELYSLVDELRGAYISVEESAQQGYTHGTIEGSVQVDIMGATKGRSRAIRKVHTERVVSFSMRLLNLTTDHERVDDFAEKLDGERYPV